MLKPAGEKPSLCAVPRDLQPGDIVATKSGRRIPFRSLIDKLSSAEIVYVGETHNSMADHRLQLQVAEALYARNHRLTVAMEMFPREAQAVLDEYSEGLLTEQEFLKKVKWHEVWGYPFELYRDLLTWAADRHLKILALNAPSDVVRKISRSGLAALTAGERSRVAAHFDFGNTRHRQFVREEFDQHIQENIRNFETFYEAQLAWEETMAETLAQELAASPGDQQILVLTGKGHIMYGFGVPGRTWERKPHSFETVMPLPVNESTQPLDPEIADFFWITQESKPFHRGRLGIMIRPASAGQGIEVIQVLPDSPAARAGIRKGDVLYEIDGTPIHTVADIHQTVALQKDFLRLKLKRGKNDLFLTVRPSPSTP